MSEHTCVYIASTFAGDCAKVGIAADVFKRLSQLQIGNPNTLEMFFAGRLPDRQTARAVEARMHQILAPFAIRGEWFSCGIDDANYAFEQAMCEQMEARGIDTPAALDGFYEPLICKAPPNG